MRDAFIVALHPWSSFKLLWRLAYMQPATLQALGKKPDGSRQRQRLTEGAGVTFGTRIGAQNKRLAMHPYPMLESSPASRSSSAQDDKTSLD